MKKMCIKISLVGEGPEEGYGCKGKLKIQANRENDLNTFLGGRNANEISKKYY